MLDQLEQVKQKPKNKKNPVFWRLIAIFIAFEIIFSAVTMPILVFYGPFENIKHTIVGISWTSFTKQWVAKTFLSDRAIYRIIGANYSVDPTAENDIELIKYDFKKNHNGKMERLNITSSNFEGKMLIIYDPTRVVAGYTSKMLKAGETTSAIAKRNGAVAAINGGGFIDDGKNWTGTGGTPLGFIIHNGKFVYGETGSDERLDTIGFTEDGNLIVGRHTEEQLKKYKMKEGISFGPPLVVNGKPTITEGDGAWGIAPRTAIGQRADGAVLLLTVDGRSVKSLGATLREIQDIMLKYKAIYAANLDGGSSTTMYFDGKVINKPSDVLGERSVSTVFMVMPEEAGASK